MFHAKFTFSPRGNSAQNFRDWESLLAGSIPLVDYDPSTSALYEGLPVVEVHDWSTVTPSWLEAKWHEMQAQAHLYSWTRAYLPYWLDATLSLVHAWHREHAHSE